MIKNTAIYAALPTTTRGQPTPLSADAKGERIAYASNKSIFLRSIDNPSQATQYTQHTATTTVARFAPSGFYCASGDASGIVRVWDCSPNGSGNTKGEYAIINGRINDIAWDGKSFTTVYTPWMALLTQHHSLLLQLFRFLVLQGGTGLLPALRLFEKLVEKAPCSKELLFEAWLATRVVPQFLFCPLMAIRVFANRGLQATAKE